ncbi:hypothetical protein B0H16DRAFT_1508474 [Mycena metata]|uniref:C3H1-type domain-containing protein n=1 Tax=Mycena metata TaxID=1033252 RepID=A0AAD7JYZ7_9AGAR|nr:hypothetical protein B0H16DRAFT_1508474 [Mycena metata]
MSSVTKKYRCRYFEEDGRPIHPTCNQGDSCRFVHPNDVNWPGLKPFIDTRLLNKPASASKRNKDASRAGGSHPTGPSGEGRGPALVSQSDLFLRCKVEGDDQSLRTDRGRPPQKDWDSKDRGRDRDRHKPYSKNRSISPTRPHTKKYSRTGSDSSKKSELDVPRSKGPTKHDANQTSNDLKRRTEGSSVVIEPKGSVDSKDSFASNSAQQTSRWAAPPSTDMVLKMNTALAVEAAPSMPLSDNRKRTERLVALFRSLARLSNQVVQETAAHEREGQKLQTYTEISTALSKISPSAANSVAPTLADIMLKHEQCKHRVEESYKALGGVWEQVFDVFVTEVVHSIDGGLQDAITTLRKEGEHAVKEIADSAAGAPRHSTTGEPYDRKRARIRGPAEKENEESRSGRGASRDRDHKRRRFASRSPSPDSHDRRNARQSGDSSIEDILTQMKMKIDQQAHSLQILSKENSDV